MYPALCLFVHSSHMSGSDNDSDCSISDQEVEVSDVLAANDDVDAMDDEALVQAAGAGPDASNIEQGEATLKQRMPMLNQRQNQKAILHQAKE